MKRSHALLIALVPLALLACQAAPNGGPPTPWSQAAVLTERAQPGGYEIFRTRVSDGFSENLTLAGGDDQQPKYAGRSERIVFVSTRDGNPEIYRMRLGGNQDRLTSDPDQDLHPGWSDDARDIVFTTDRDGNMEIYRMESDGSNPTRLTNDPGADAEADWSPDGSTIAFTSNRTGDWEIFTMDSATGANQAPLISRPDWDDVDPVWSPDGTMVAFESRDRRGNRPDNTDVFVMSANGTGLVNLTNTPNDDHEVDPAWSQDGTVLAYASFDPTNANLDIYFVEVATGTVQTRVLNMTLDERSPAFTEP
jgi:TolB protein